MISMMGVALASCGSDNDGDDWKDNTSDVAVTGSATNVTFYSATIGGVINLNQTQTLASNARVLKEIEYDTAEHYDSHNYFDQSVSIEEIVGNKVSVELSGLVPETKYVYRTVVEVNGVKYAGENRYFTTSKLPQAVKSVKVTETTESWINMTVMVDEDDFEHAGVEIFVSEHKEDLEDIAEIYSINRVKTAKREDRWDSEEGRYYIYDNDYVYLKDGEHRYSVSNLDENTTYYYRYVTFSYVDHNDHYVASGISSFKTKGGSKGDDENDDDNDVTEAATAVMLWSQIVGTWTMQQNSQSGTLMVLIEDSGRMQFSDGTTWEARLQDGYPQIITVTKQDGTTENFDIHGNGYNMTWYSRSREEILTFKRVY